MEKTNVILTGMPGVGKSTIGQQIANKLKLNFIDTDQIIVNHEKQALQTIINEKGIQHFKNIEEKYLCQLHYKNSIIATGGSAIYSQKAMEHLSQLGKIFFLDLDYNLLVQRIHNMNNRGMVLKDGQSFLSLYEERIDLYHQFSEVTINCNNKSILEIRDEIIKHSHLDQ